MADFFYDGQLRRYIVQFIKLLSKHYVTTGKDSTGNEALIQVPVIYGDSTHQVAAIIAHNSENNLPSVPQISCYVTGLNYNRDYILNPNHVDKVNVKERFYDKDKKKYTGAPGESFTVERSMPTPYLLTMNADIWTSNTEQKLQLIEQICYMFNPSLEIQTNKNVLDWTNIVSVELTEFNWSSRSVPQGSEVAIDIMTMTFEIKVWIAPPANIKRLGVIEKVIMDVFDGQGDLSNSVLNEAQSMGDRQYYTPLNYGVLLLNGKLQVVKVNEPISGQGDDFNHIEKKYGPPVPWPQVIGQYGSLTVENDENENNIKATQIKLLQSVDVSNVNHVYDEVVGYVSYNAEDDTILDFVVDEDTIPTTTLDPVDAVINPIKNGPDAGLKAAATGQRYIILNDIGDGDNKSGFPSAWPGIGENVGLIAKRNDIIQYNGTGWFVAFSQLEKSELQYIMNLTTGIQYKWTSEAWIKSFEGSYPAGEWSILLSPK